MWNGNEMIQTSPSGFDQELFTAMAARDLNGTLPSWLLYRVLRVPTLIVYYLALIFVTGMLMVKTGRSTRLVWLETSRTFLREWIANREIICGRSKSQAKGLRRTSVDITLSCIDAKITMMKTILIVLLACAIAQSDSLRMQSSGDEGYERAITEN